MYRKSCVALLCLLLASAIPATAQQGESLPVRAIRDTLDIDATRQEFPYSVAEDTELALDIYFPRQPKPKGGWPVIIWFHGGGWILGSKRQDVFVRHFPRYGYAVVSVQYRLAMGANFPDQIRDARAACRWVWENSDKLNLDRDRIMLAGQSAGAHLALLAAYTADRPLKNWGPTLPKGTVKAVAAMYPPTDLLRLVPRDSWGNALHPVALLLGAEVSARIRLARSASPINQVRRGAPPTLLLHGTKDSIVPVEQSVLLDKRLRSLGVPVTLNLVDDGHGFLLYPEKVEDVLKFIETVPALAGSTNDEPLPEPPEKRSPASKKRPGSTR